MPKTTLTGAQATIECLAAQGVTHVFGNPGTTEAPFMVAMEDYPGIEYVLGLQEGAVMGMADAYARVALKVAVAHLHISVGLANGLSGLYNAHRGGTPLVLLAGQSDTRTYEEEPALYGDLVAMARPYTKWSAEVLHARDIPMILHRAFKVARTPPTGPVFVSLPINVLEESATYSQAELQTLGEGPTLPPPSVSDVSRIAEMLVGAEHPVLLIGDRVAQFGGQDALVRVAEALKAPVFAVYHSEFVFPTDHPLYCGEVSPWFRSDLGALREADVVLALGADIGYPFLYEPRDLIPPSAALIHLDSSAWAIGRVYPVLLGCVCDLAAAAHGLADAVEASSGDAVHTPSYPLLPQHATRHASQREALDAEALATRKDVPISPAYLAVALRDAMPHDAVLIDEGLTFTPLMRRALTFRHPGSFYFLRGGAIGWGCGAAVGAALANPRRRTVAVIGDGSALYTIQALWTAAHYRLPITYLFVNNGSYRILRLNLIRHLGEKATEGMRFLGTDLRHPSIDLRRVAEGLGVPGIRVERPEDLGRALSESMMADGPSVLDVVVEDEL